MRHLIDRYPAFYRNCPEFRDIQEALEPEVLAVRSATDDFAAQLNVETATWGLSLWERTLGLAAGGDGDLESRRGRIRARLRGAGVTTAATVRTVAESFFSGEAEVTEHPGQFLAELRFLWEGGRPPDLENVTAALREILPAHLAVAYEIVRHMAFPKYTAQTGGTYVELHGCDAAPGAMGRCPSLAGGAMAELAAGDGGKGAVKE